MTWALQILVMLGRILLSFYGFWLVWRVLLPLLPGPDDADERIAPYACYFTDPFLQPLARLTRVPVHTLAILGLVGVAAGQVALPG